MTMQRPVTIFLRDRPIVEWQRVMAALWILRGVKLRIETGSYNSVLSWLHPWGDWKVEMLDDIIGISVAGQCNIFGTSSMLPNVFISHACPQSFAKNMSQITNNIRLSEKVMHKYIT